MAQNTCSECCPAKVNLYLAICGKREDGYHDLISLMVALDFGDHLEVRLISDGTDILESSDASIAGPDNLVLKAAALFRKYTKIKNSFHFKLKKHVPIGAGLGGGSSDAVSALKCMNRLCGGMLAKDQLLELAAELGSDCPFFVNLEPSILRGRGEQIEVMRESAYALNSKLTHLMLFKPPFSVSTAWAYQAIRREGQRIYVSAPDAENALKTCFKGSDSEPRLFNTFEAIVGAKYRAIPTLLGQLRKQFGLTCMMSGSGSACFALLRPDLDLANIEKAIKAAWGQDAFFRVVSVLDSTNQEGFSPDYMHTQ